MNEIFTFWYFSHRLFTPLHRRHFPNPKLSPPLAPHRALTFGVRRIPALLLNKLLTPMAPPFSCLRFGVPPFRRQWLSLDPTGVFYTHSLHAAEPTPAKRDESRAPERGVHAASTSPFSHRKLSPPLAPHHALAFGVRRIAGIAALFAQ